MEARGGHSRSHTSSAIPSVCRTATSPGTRDRVAERRAGSVTPVNVTILVLGVLVAVAAAVRSTWSPCGQSMLSQLTPVGEASRGYRYRTTASWFVVGAIVGGATLGAVMAVLAAAVSAIGATSTALLGIAAGVAVLGAAVDGGVLGFAPPFFKRQVNEYWLTRYRA